jgi:hypothetical protein
MLDSSLSDIEIMLVYTHTCVDEQVLLLFCVQNQLIRRGLFVSNAREKSSVC